jgi:hypothetical protein
MKIDEISGYLLLYIYTELFALLPLNNTATTVLSDYLIARI